MARINKIVLPLLSLCSLSATNPPSIAEPLKPKVCSDGVLSLFTNEDVILPLLVSETIYYQFEMSFRFVNIATHEFVYFKNIKRTDLTLNHYDLVLPFEQYLNPDGINIVFTATMAKDKTEISTAKILPFKEEAINVSAYRKEPYVRDGAYLSIDDTKINSKETYDFTDLNEYLTLGKNNRLDLSNIKFKYLCPHPLTCGDIYLKIKDHRNLFPNVNKVNGEVSLKMKFEQEEDNISLKLDEKLYVNKTTLEMSSTYLDNYDEVDTLFLPNGKEKMLCDDEIYITIKDAGYSLTDITIPFSFYFTNKYVGECYESDYCISGGVRQWYIT